MKGMLCVAILVCVLVGCDTEQHQPQPQQPSPQAQQPVAPKKVHSFKPLPYTGGDLALDESTGQKCRTWDWNCGCYSRASDKLAKSDTSYEASQRYLKEIDACDGSSLYGMRCDAIGSIPTCDKL
jgi:hypothetical protein